MQVKIPPINIFSIAIMKKIGNIVIQTIKKESKKGIGSDGEKWDSYDDLYAKMKSEGGRKTRGANKGKKRFPRQSSKQTSPPNLRLSGDMMRDLKQIGRATKTNVRVGWPTFGARVIHNIKNGRSLGDENNPISPSAQAKIDKMVHTHIVKELNKKPKKITHKIG